MLNFLLLTIGFVFLIYGANKLVDAASDLARRLNVPNLVIGLTIVAFGTSAPELSVNLIAAARHSTDIALGNVIGSNILNILLILGISALFAPLSVKSSTTWIEIPLAFLSALVVLAMAADPWLDQAGQDVISRSDGIILLFFFTIFLVYNFQLARRGGNEEESMETKLYTTPKAVLYILFGLALLLVGGRLIVDNAVALARLAGWPERIIGLTVVSIGTSLPELATSIVAARKRNTDLAIGNIVGSNIFNVFLILGLSSVIYPIPVAEGAIFDILVNILASALLFVFIFTGKGRRLDRSEGILFLLIYFAYLVWLIWYR
ncbi:MAG: calcium/sodium antiporter [Phaeodactylibacter sp.]|nr:calcium/sodium antiporter [Phaeodactylibacter sp.]MCB9304472.1 calcium/sodium antiporter [Lewinellaceae bacterium]HQU58089.1 calcium/sodium antiporter [Saprospiraceae bacterium]